MQLGNVTEPLEPGIGAVLGRRKDLQKDSELVNALDDPLVHHPLDRRRPGVFLLAAAAPPSLSGAQVGDVVLGLLHLVLIVAGDGQPSRVPIDVDVGESEVGDDFGDGGPFGSDDPSDLAHFHLHGGDLGHGVRQRRADAGTGGLHLIENVESSPAGLFEGAFHGGHGEPFALDVQLKGADAVAVAGHLEVHGAEGVLRPGDVAENDGGFVHVDGLFLFGKKQPHGDPSDVSRDGDPGVHQGQAASADGGHAGASVAFGDEALQTDHVGPFGIVVVRDDGEEGAFGQHPVSDLAAAGAAHPAGLADAAGRKGVLQIKFFLVHPGDRVDFLHHVESSEGGGGDRLGLAAGEEGGAVDFGEDGGFDGDGADGVGGPAVGAGAGGLGVGVEAGAQEFFHGGGDLGVAGFGNGFGDGFFGIFGHGGEGRGEGIFFHVGGVGFVDTVFQEGFYGFFQIRRGCGYGMFAELLDFVCVSFGFVDGLFERFYSLADNFDGLVSRSDRLDHLFLRQKVGEPLDHEHPVFGPRHHQMQGTFFRPPPSWD
mmetsp:Transcript_6919/g.14939  ORF Transcript_6919/g.14939 Transcript_6919/m.14939 type:complete len:539 (+) Transcript_6919:284-1900(+)